MEDGLHLLYTGSILEYQPTGFLILVVTAKELFPHVLYSSCSSLAIALVSTGLCNWERGPCKKQYWEPTTRPGNQLSPSFSECTGEPHISCDIYKVEGLCSFRALKSGLIEAGRL